MDRRSDRLQIKIFEDKAVLGRTAAEHAARSLRAYIAGEGVARIVAATGASQFEFLEALTSATEVDWSRIELFHLDEYVGLPVTHPASFSRYILDRLIGKTAITRYHLLDGQGDPQRIAKEVGKELVSGPVHLVFVGIGENGHLAFNDPPADFQSEEPYRVVDLDEACRRQQVNEGWFADLADVPTKAISMSVRQILRAKEIIVIVPDLRKAPAVKACLEGEISPSAPASILREHANVTVYLDQNSASLLSGTGASTK
jgi:glucosamine-6-phosphate deaminase